jgi:hypothetical protein
VNSYQVYPVKANNSPIVNTKTLNQELRGTFQTTHYDPPTPAIPLRGHSGPKSEHPPRSTTAGVSPAQHRPKPFHPHPQSPWGDIPGQSPNTHQSPQPQECPPHQTTLCQLHALTSPFLRKPSCPVSAPVPGIGPLQFQVLPPKFDRNCISPFRSLFGRCYTFTLCVCMGRRVCCVHKPPGFRITICPVSYGHPGGPD